MKLENAKRQKVKLRIGISGPSGFGKTYSALLMANGITNDWSRIAVIDTEGGSSNLYSHLGEFKVLQLKDSFSPENYIEAISICEKAEMDVIIIDSITHEWQGRGGCLELHEQLGGRFQDWAKITPRHNAFIDAILNSPCHIITTARRKTEYSLNIGQNGKTKVIKHGTKEITREGFEYELTVNFELVNRKYFVKASKDRTGLFLNKLDFIINASTGKKLQQWCNIDEVLTEAIKEIQKATTVEGLRHIYSKHEDLRAQLHPLIIKRKNLLEHIKENVQTPENVSTNEKDKVSE
ncbi:MAG: AAA family ATPase [Flavobacteriaceae bacterium]|nr:AAA family ATPase [Flavobacteriaceae bacterium]